MSESEKHNDLAHMISPYSIAVYGDSVGHNYVSENALLALSYNVTYKVYEILRVSNLVCLKSYF